MTGAQRLSGAPALTARVDAEYVVPFRAADGADGDAALRALAAYLADLVSIVDTTVVDDSPAALRPMHRRLFDERVRVLTPAPRAGRNGKVRAVMTGVATARHERVVLADDDVRYAAPSLLRVVRLLDDADLVRPQNVFVPAPWHARWDTGRVLVNRAFGGDWPGTFALRRSVLLAVGGYDGDVLFENLELLRTIRAAGGRVRSADDLFVPRCPPTGEHFWGQRVRQAYDSFAQPRRLAAEAAIVPLILWSLRRPRWLVVAAALAVCVGEAGRRRMGGRQAFPPTAALWAPVWVVERGVCSWLALGARVRGGVRYSDGRLRRAAHSTRALRERTRAAAAAPATATATAPGPEPARARARAQAASASVRPPRTTTAGGRP